MNMECAARIHQYGAPEVLAVEPVEVTAPGPGEVRIRHKAIGLNFVEVYFRRGTFPVPAFPAILGNEAAGVVEAVGRDVRGVAVGDRVAYADGPLGSYATARLYPADLVVRIPDVISDAQAAASFLRGVTARSLLKEVVRLQPTIPCSFTRQPAMLGSCSPSGRGRWAFASSEPYPMRARQR